MTVLARPTAPAGARKQLAAIFVCILSCLSAACSTTEQAEIGLAAPPAAAAADSRTQAALRQLLSVPSRKAEADIVRFYAARDFAPAWSGSDEARDEAVSAIGVLQHAEQQGLRPADYPVKAVHGEPAPGRAAALYDLSLTQSLLRYAHDVRLGRLDPHKVYSDIELPVQTFDAAPELDAALEHHGIDAFLASLPPPDAQYRALADALARYRIIAAKGGWRRVSAKTAPQALAERLAAEDPTLAGVAHPSAAEVKAALKHFQASHGLQPDGRMSKDTLAALNVPASKRVEEIAANMERWRWLPRQFESRYILVDVPDQSVDFIDNGKSLLHSKAIIGRDDNRTPILRTMANAVVVNPPWDIPDDIAAKAILPHLRKDPNYLERRNMVLVDAPKNDPRGRRINWRKVKGADLPYQIREEPGPHNVLGALMLDMPNDFDTYLHGTSNAATFDLADRERSHGCVRVQKAVSLAAIALEGSVSNPRDSLKQDIAGGKTDRVPLASPLPVYILYWTAHAENDGDVAFRPDRYNRDQPLIARLMTPEPHAATSHRPTSHGPTSHGPTSRKPAAHVHVRKPRPQLQAAIP